MNRTSAPLTFREPVYVFIAAGMFVALLVHGLCWMSITGLLSDPRTAVAETSRQVGLALCWVVASIFLWSVQNPKSRFKAVLMTLGCVLFIGAVGTLGVLFSRFQNANDYSAGVHAVVLLSVLLGQTLLAVPASLLLQWVVLRPAPDSHDPA